MQAIRLLLILFCLVHPISGKASIIKKPPAKAVELTYHDLVCTEQDQENIYEIITTMADSSKLQLLFKQSHLKGLGTQVEHVHPLKFLETIFVHPHLKSCMGYIWTDYFKRNGFLEGLSPSLSREADKGKLNQHIPHFAEALAISPDIIRPFFDVRDWENMVFQLIQNNDYGN